MRAFLRALSASVLALAGRGVAERAADLGCSAVDPAADGRGGNLYGGSLEETIVDPWRTNRDVEATSSMAGYGAEEAGSCDGARLSSWRREDIGNGRRMARQVGEGPDPVIPDDGWAVAVSMLRGRLEAPAAGMVVFPLKKLEGVQRERRETGER